MLTPAAGSAAHTRSSGIRLPPSPPEATTLMVGLIRGGLVKLEDFDVTTFDLDQANQAVAHAAAHSGPFKMTVIQPG